ncbi:type II restriction endonuclease [Brevundimonas sp.]|uniref:type II restriction endonuclease n=1 Tax=Brevundimonas sp. TaxID=1871086 RepID=UPI0035B3D6ED
MTVQKGWLSAYFRGVAVKRLAAVDASRASNQHEVTGSEPLLRILGDSDRTFPRGGCDSRFPASYIWLGGEGEALTEDGELSWYNARRRVTTRRAEWRLYYQANAVTGLMQPGDSLFIAVRPEGQLLFIVTPEGTTAESQLLWLFGLGGQPRLEFEPKTFGPADDTELDFASRFILDEIGIDAEEPDAERFDELLEPFGLVFPRTAVFSELARTSVTGVSAIEEPDRTLMAWMEREELLFRRLERRIVGHRIATGFRSGDGEDVDGFLSFSLSVQNRRKSRVGHALEHHLAAVLQAHDLRFARGAETENRNKPDFLFPSVAAYRDPAFPIEGLTVLGAKSTLKDRWRQVLSEASRIPDKHLLTLEPGISVNQTAEMSAKRLKLVIPRPIHATYRTDQRESLMDLADFITVARDRQLLGEGDNRRGPQSS